MKSKITLAVMLLVMSILVLSFSSCAQKKMGYSVLLWSLPEENLSDGTIVPVYIRSNIMHCYVIGIPGTDKKCEVPLWQITKPSGKLKAKSILKKHSEYVHKYACVKKDGLPIRQETENGARQVYRSREGEILKVLYKGTGQKPMSGNKPMEGDWLRVLTNDGTSGWCFSYNLKIFDENDISSLEEIESEIMEENLYTDELLNFVMTSTWYPDEYQKMIKEDRIDLATLNPDYKFDTGFQSLNVSLNLKDVKISFPFQGLTKIEDDVYSFNDSPLTMTIRNESSILLQYSDELGYRKNYYLVPISEDINSIIEKEKERREGEFKKILNAGPEFTSSNYGTLSFSEGNLFEWTGYRLLTQSLIPADSGNSGSVSFEYFIQNTLKPEYDGIITFTFDKTGHRINFLYKVEGNGIRLEDAKNARFKKQLMTERSPNPVVIFFAG